jgi:hypothetical protein
MASLIGILMLGASFLTLWILRPRAGRNAVLDRIPGGWEALTLMLVVGFCLGIASLVYGLAS